MKKIFFNQNQYLKENNFSTKLKKEVSKMMKEYLKKEIAVPEKFEVFNQTISDLVIKIDEEQDTLKKQKRKIKSIKKVNTIKWRKKKFIK